MAITLITATIGSGKTLYSIGLMDKINKEGRAIYQNIEGLDKSKFDKPALIFDAPNDWRDTPHGSVLFYDEAQKPNLYPSTSQRVVSDERLTALETSRHQGYDFYFITQSPDFVHNHIRKLATAHIHLYRGLGMKGATVYEWSHVVSNPNSRTEQTRANKFVWGFPKKYFSYYQSATQHTHKFKMPRKLLYLMILIFGVVAMLVKVGFERYHHYDDIIEEKPIAEGTVGQSSGLDLAPVLASKNFAWASGAKFGGLKGCIHNDKACYCYSSKSELLDLSNGQCRSIVVKPLPMSLKD